MNPKIARIIQESMENNFLRHAVHDYNEDFKMYRRFGLTATTEKVKLL